jgi:hypothetical protein
MVLIRCSDELQVALEQPIRATFQGLRALISTLSQWKIWVKPESVDLGSDLVLEGLLRLASWLFCQKLRHCRGVLTAVSRRRWRNEAKASKSRASCSPTGQETFGAWPVAFLNAPTFRPSPQHSNRCSEPITPIRKVRVRHVGTE